MDEISQFGPIHMRGIVQSFMTQQHFGFCQPLSSTLTQYGIINDAITVHIPSDIFIIDFITMLRLQVHPYLFIRDSDDEFRFPTQHLRRGARSVTSHGSAFPPRSFVSNSRQWRAQRQPLSVSAPPSAPQPSSDEVPMITAS